MENHLLKNDPIYETWRGIIKRCEVKNNSGYKYYGARGITFAPEWRKDFYAFKNYVGLKPSPTHSIDRIDTNGNYEPGNVRWATPSQQARNRRLFKSNISGYPGVIWYKKYNRWHVYLTIKKPERVKHIGYYTDLEEAISARLAAESGVSV